VGVLVALRKQKVSVLFSKGAQTKVDHKALPIDDLVVLENGEFNKIGRIDKRTGFSKVTESSSALVTYKDDLLSRNVRTTSSDNSKQTEVYSKSNTAMRGTKGWSEGLNYISYPVSKGSSYHQKDPQVSISQDGKYALVTFVAVDHKSSFSMSTSAHYSRTFNGQVTKRCTVIDRQTNTILKSDIKIGIGDSVGGTRMRSLWVDDKFFIFGEDYAWPQGNTGTASDLRLWIIDPTEEDIRLRDLAGSTSQAGTSVIGSSSYPLEAENVGSGSSAFPWNQVGASFDVCHSSQWGRVNLMATRVSGSTYYMSYYQYDYSTGIASVKWSDMITAHGVAVGDLPVYYTIYKSLGDGQVYFAYQDATKFYVRRSTDGGSSGTVVVDETITANSNTRCSFVETSASSLWDGVDLYTSYSNTSAGTADYNLGIHKYPYIHSATSGVTPIKMSHGSLAFAMSHKNSLASQEGPVTVAGYTADPIPGTFDGTDESTSEDFLDTIRLWTSDPAISVNVDGTSYSGKGYLHERDYLKYGSLETSHLTDALKVAAPGFLSGTVTVEGQAVAVPVATNYNAFDSGLVVNSLIYVYDFRPENYATKPKASTAILQDTLYVADNGLFSYDGAEFNLHGLTSRPWLGRSTASYPHVNGYKELDTTGTPAPVYLYKGVFEWEDALGNLHQSEPSGHISLTSPDGDALTYHPSNDLISKYKTPDIHYDSPSEIYRDVRFALYRTEGNGATYNLNRVVRNFNRLYSMKGIIDGKADEVNALGRFLYTDTGELPNTPPPSPAIYVTAHKNRLFIIGKDRRVYFSKLAIPGYGLAFSPALEIKLPDPASDSPVALGSMDGSLVVFTEKSIYHITGDGPDNLGSNGFYEPKKIPSVSGASYCTPVRLIDQGLLFTNKGGIFILDRDGKVSEIGSPADDMTKGKKILDIVVDEEKKIVYFQTSSETEAELITYNYLFGQWGKHELGGETSIDSIARYGDGVAISCGDSLYFSSAGYKDNNVYIPLKLRTSWIKLDTYKGVHKFSSLQGYQRVYNFQILGESKDAHRLVVNVYYDYDNETIVDTYTYPTTSTSSQKLQLKGHLSKQRCNAVQFEIYDSETGVTPATGEGFTISHIELEIGQKLDQYKDGLMKIPGSQNFGVT